MNELSNKVFSELASMRNFFKQRAHSGEKIKFDTIDVKLFFLFQSNLGNEAKAPKKKPESQSDSKYNSESSKNEKVEYSLRDLSVMTTKELSGKIFTFDRKLATEDMTKMSGEGKNIDKVVKGLPSMKGIDEEYIPKFKFIQFKISEMKNANGDKRTMLCFNDIS